MGFRVVQQMTLNDLNGQDAYTFTGNRKQFAGSAMFGSCWFYILTFYSFSVNV